MTPEEHARILKNRKKADAKYQRCGKLKLVKRKKEQGICTQCSKPALYPHIRCKKHHEVALRVGRENGRKYRKRLKDEGRCIGCGAYLIEEEKGYSKCINCRARIHTPRLNARTGG
jgi:hypothetical protein